MGSHYTPARRLPRKSIRALLYFLLSLIALLFLLGPRRVSTPFYSQQQQHQEESIIDSNKVSPLVQAHQKAALFPTSFNPLSETTPLTPGPWHARFPSLVAVNQPFRLRIDCTHADAALCPRSYNIHLYGPTAAAVPITALTAVSPRAVEAAMILHEQGDYQVYAWPATTAANCTTDAVAGTPHVLTAQPGPFMLGREKRDVHRACTSHDEVLDGRWISAGTVKTDMRAAYGYARDARFVYSPYGCKIPRRGFADVVDALPALRHVLFIGGPVARGYLCARGGLLAGSDVCGVQHRGHSVVTASRVHAGRRHGRPAAVTFVYLGGGGGFHDAVRHLDKLQRPQVVVFDVGDLALLDGEFTAAHGDALDYFHGRWRGVHVLFRSGASVVQPLLEQCDEGGPTREGAWRRRGLTLDAIAGWVGAREREKAGVLDDLEMEEGAAGDTRVSFVDAYSLTDLRPETSVDGVLWSALAGLGGGRGGERPAVGEADEMLMDWVWDEVVTGRAMARV